MRMQLHREMLLIGIMISWLLSLWGAGCLFPLFLHPALHFHMRNEYCEILLTLTQFYALVYGPTPSQDAQRPAPRFPGVQDLLQESLQCREPL